MSLVLNLVGVWWGLPARYGWAPDELHPDVIREGIAVRFSGDWHQPAYPPLHYYLLALLELPVLALDWVDPRSVPGTTALFALGRALSIVMGVGIVLVVYGLGRRLFGERAGLFGAAVASLNAPFVYYAKTANLDVPLAFWALLSLYFFLRLLETEALRHYLLFTLTAVAAMGTKDQAFAFYVIPLASFAVLRFRRERSLARVLLDRRALLSLGVGVLAFLGIHNVLFNTEGFLHHFEEILWARGHYSAFENGFAQQLGMVAQTLWHLKFSYGWPLALACAGGVALSLARWRSRPDPLWLLAAILSYYVFFIAPVLSTWLRYALPIGLLLAPFGGYFLAELAARAPFGKLVVASALVYSFAYAASVDVLLLTDSRYEVEAWLRQNVPPGETIAYMGPEYYLPRVNEIGGQRLRPTESVLARQSPEFLVVNAEFAERFEPGSREHELFERLAAGRAGYALVFEHQSHPRTLLSFEGVLANMSKLDPLIRVYQRAE